MDGFNGTFIISPDDFHVAIDQTKQTCFTSPLCYVCDLWLGGHELRKLEYEAWKAWERLFDQLTRLHIAKLMLLQLNTAVKYENNTSHSQEYSVVQTEMSCFNKGLIWTVFTIIETNRNRFRKNRQWNIIFHNCFQCFPDYFQRILHFSCVIFRVLLLKQSME